MPDRRFRGEPWSGALTSRPPRSWSGGVDPGETDTSDLAGDGVLMGADPSLTRREPMAGPCSSLAAALAPELDRLNNGRIWSDRRLLCLRRSWLGSDSSPYLDGDGERDVGWLCVVWAETGLGCSAGCGAAAAVATATDTAPSVSSWRSTSGPSDLRGDGVLSWPELRRGDTAGDVAGSVACAIVNSCDVLRDTGWNSCDALADTWNSCEALRDAGWNSCDALADTWNSCEAFRGTGWNS